MVQAAAVIGIIASFLGLIAAAVTLLFGGAASAFGTSGAGTVLNLGWGGGLFSVAALVASALVYAAPRGAGIALIVIALSGAVLGGTLVAACMVLVLIAGVLALLGTRGKQPSASGVASLQPGETSARPRRRASPLVWGLGGVAALIMAGLLVLVWLTPTDKGAATATVEAAPSRPNPLAELESATASDLQPTGELAALFELGGAATDVQRENAFRAIEGKIVVWELPVYDITRHDGGYRITTENHVLTLFGPSPMVATRLTLNPRNEAERERIEALKTGQMIRFKGRITGIVLRRFEIDPAILWAAAPAKPDQAAAVPTPSSAASRDIDGLVKQFLADCKAGTRQKAIEFGGMPLDEAGQHATETCAGSLPAFQACLTQTSKDADACATAANPSAE